VTIEQSVTRDRATFTAPVTIFTHATQIARVIVPDGARIIFLARDLAPQLIPVEGQGEYELDCLELTPTEGTFPFGLAVADLKFAPAWLALSPAQVGRVIDRFEHIIRAERTARAETPEGLMA
jgi:hypothetical protein